MKRLWHQPSTTLVENGSDVTPAGRAHALRQQAATIRDGHVRFVAEETARLEALGESVLRSQAALDNASSRASQQVNVLERAADIYGQAANAQAGIPRLRDAVDNLSVEVDRARSEIEALTVRRDQLAAEVVSAHDDEKSADPALAITARGRRLAAQALVAEAAEDLSRAESRLADVIRQHELAQTRIDEAQREALSLLQLGEDTLSGEADRRAAAQAEEDARAAANAKVARDRELARVMLGADYREALVRTVEGQQEPQIAGWRFLPPRKRGA